jgi:hypothetical protein
MANEAIIDKGSYTSLIASEAEVDGAFSTISASVDTVLTDGTELYALFDFKLDVTSGVPIENGLVHLYRVPMDGTDQAPTPAGSYKPHYVDSFTLDSAVDEYYVFGVPNVDENDKFIWQNDQATTITCTLYVRGRTYAPSA